MNHGNLYTMLEVNSMISGCSDIYAKILSCDSSRQSSGGDSILFYLEHGRHQTPETRTERIENLEMQMQHDPYRKSLQSRIFFFDRIENYGY